MERGFETGMRWKMRVWGAKFEVFQKLASETTVDGWGILLDLRGSPCRMTLGQMYALARELGNIDPPYNERIAMMFDPSRCDQVTGPEVTAPTLGFTVAHFGVFEKAMRWLNTSDVKANDR